ncbi:MAG TPA: S41 family peptidase [Spirochaetota bacterium]|nr:S41 family peptidase [Spirochaetota bacterium]HPI89810.1 S41 family peptidase [Spirochaetota bacterium]HPR49380.1 S41 family peptidase [Spirochaetota bacterium]
MLKKIRERNVHLFVFTFCLGLFLGVTFSYRVTATETAHKYLDYFHNVYQIIMSEYVRPTSNKDLFYGAIDGMIKSLDDPYSRFLDEKSYEELKEMTTGKFVGVGIEITMQDDEIIVITPIEDSPAMKSGISAGDIITRVDGKNIKGKKLSEIVKMIKGLPGTKVTLSVYREGADDTIDYELTREAIKLKSVEYDLIEGNNIGYMKIKNFGSDTTKDVVKAIKYFNSKKSDRAIIDLRYNPGGLLNAAVTIADLFLEKGKTIVSTKGRSDTRKEETFKSENDPLYTGDIILLVNKGSASASEILSGAIRDNKRGKLLGEKTFGKGSVQKSFNLDENLGVAITVAYYYTPSGELIHGKGIKPDIALASEKFSDTEQKILKKIENDKLIENFVTKGMQYNEDTKKKFYEYLKKNNVEISGRSADFLLKSGIYQFKKRPIYDMEFDIQLSKAAEIISR